MRRIYPHQSSFSWNRRQAVGRSSLRENHAPSRTRVCVRTWRARSRAKLVVTGRGACNLLRNG